jgi:hypothetical protein
MYKNCTTVFKIARQIKKLHRSLNNLSLLRSRFQEKRTVGTLKPKICRMKPSVRFGKYCSK